MHTQNLNDDTFVVTSQDGQVTGVARLDDVEIPVPAGARATGHRTDLSPEIRAAIVEVARAAQIIARSTVTVVFDVTLVKNNRFQDLVDAVERLEEIGSPPNRPRCAAVIVDKALRGRA